MREIHDSGENADAVRRKLGFALLLVLSTAVIGTVLCSSAAAPQTASARMGLRRPENAWAQGAVPTATVVPITPADTARQQRIFQRLWNIVNERYVYPDFNGVDWAQVRTETNKRIAAGLTNAEFHDLMRGLIDGLNDNHSSFLSPTDAKEEDADFDGSGSYVGIGIVSDINAERRYVYVLTVFPESPAERAGIMAHDQILQIGGTPSVGDDGESRTVLLRGNAGTTVTLTVRTPGQEPREVMVERGPVNSNEPMAQQVLMAGSKRIGYLMVPSLFQENIANRSRQALRELMRAGNNRLDGLILDLRTNGGGTYDNLRALLGFFTQGRMGSLTNRDGDASVIRVRAERVGNSQAVPLVVLIGPGTESFAEVLAGALQASGRATVIGQNSAGNIETLLSHEFEDGSRMWLAEETFRLPTGRNFEGTGVTPDVPIDIGWDDYTAANDPVIAAALERLSQ